MSKNRNTHTLAGHSTVFIPTQLYPTNYVRLTGIIFLAQRSVCSHTVFFYRQMQICGPFKWEHSSFRASENNRGSFGDRHRAIRTAKLCLREWDMFSNPSILMIPNIRETEKETAVFTKKHSSPPTSMSHKVQQDPKYFSNIFNLKG